MISWRARVAIQSMMLVTYASLLIVFGIVFILLTQSAVFFQDAPFASVFSTTKWSLQDGLFGVYPLFLGTFLIVIIALLVATPIALPASVYMSEYIPRKWVYAVRPFLEVLTGIPTVVYGFLAVILIAPGVKNLGDMLGVRASGESALAAGIAMGLMLIPSMVSLMSDALQAVPAHLRENAYALGSTRAETIWHIVLPAAKSDLFGVMLLTISRGIGETMIVVMAAGLSARITLEPFQSVTTVTVQIVNILLGDQDYGSPKTLVAFVLGLLLFLVTLALNMVALFLLRVRRINYD